MSKPAHERIRAVAQNLRDSTLGDALEIASDDAADTLDAIAEEVTRERDEQKKIALTENQRYLSVERDREIWRSRCRRVGEILWGESDADDLGCETAWTEALRRTKSRLDQQAALAQRLGSALLGLVEVMLATGAASETDTIIKNARAALAELDNEKE